MIEISGDIWDYYDQGHWIVITTNGTIKNNGEAVMGRGVALQAKQKYSQFPLELGQFIKEYGNILFFWWFKRIITFPVKHHWRNQADIQLIEKSCQDLSNRWKSPYDILYMVRPGCGNGGLNWADVKPILEKYLDDRFVVVNSLVAQR